MRNKKLQLLVMSALLAALVCAATAVIHIPSPMNGYVNLGDCFVLLCGWLLGPYFGFFAAGAGSALADLLLGYPHYIPGTFVIKGLMAVTAWLLTKVLVKAFRGKVSAARIVSAVGAEAVMVAGYFLYASLLLGKGLAAAASIPGNLIQGVCGAISSVLIMEIFDRTGLSEKIVTAGYGNGKRN